MKEDYYKKLKKDFIKKEKEAEKYRKEVIKYISNTIDTRIDMLNAKICIENFDKKTMINFKLIKEGINTKSKEIAKEQLIRLNKLLVLTKKKINNKDIINLMDPMIKELKDFKIKIKEYEEKEKDKKL